MLRCVVVSSNATARRTRSKGCASASSHANSLSRTTTSSDRIHPNRVIISASSFRPITILSEDRNKNMTWNHCSTSSSSSSISSIHKSYLSTLSTTTTSIFRRCSPHDDLQHLQQPTTNHNNNISHHQKRYKVFVSRHNNHLNVTSQQIIEYCNNHGIQNTQNARITPTHVILEECPFCTKPTNNKIDNLYKCYIMIGGGAYYCHRCGTNGSWYDFKSNLGGYHITQGIQQGGAATSTSGNTSVGSGYGNNGGGGFSGYGNSNGGGASIGSYSNGTIAGSPPQAMRVRAGGGGGDNNWSIDTANNNHLGGVIRGGNDTTVPCLPMPQAKLSAVYSSALLDGNRSSNDTDTSTNDDDNIVLKYLIEKRGLTKKTLRKYGVGRAIYNFPSNKIKGGGNTYYEPAECVTFPWIMRASDVALQEELRGAKFPLPPPTTSETEKEKATTVGGSSSSKKKENDDNGNDNNPKSNKDDNDEKAAHNNNIHEMSTPPVCILNEMPTGKFVTRRIKARAINQKSWQRLDPPGGGWGLFGLHTVPDDATEIVLTEGEYDAMAVWQATNIPAVSLPNGCRSLPVQVLPLLERFDKVYLWMDNDRPGQEGAEKFAKKIGWNRCYLVKGSSAASSENGSCSSAKDANDALLKGLNLMDMLKSARQVPHDRILTFHDLRNDVLDELINPNRFTGVPMKSLPKFTNVIKGFRRGELTVLTGPTGSGKTTFLGQASLDLAEQGINCLWGSFEIKNTRLVHKLLQQFGRGQLPKKKNDGDDNDGDSNNDSSDEIVQQLHSIADRFEELPLYFMKFHGSSEVDQVLDAMEYAVYVNDVEHIILDNLQFMISRIATKGNKSSTFDKFDVQDVAIEKFRKFATEHNVHITLVVHPKKEAESMQLNISSFYGSAKATQEADTVVILQYDGRRKYLDVKKNRFDGTLGSIPIHFHRDSGRYVEEEQGSPQQQSGAPAENNYGHQQQSRKSYWKQKSKPEEVDIDMNELDNLWEDRLAPPYRV